MSNYRYHSEIYHKEFTSQYYIVQSNFPAALRVLSNFVGEIFFPISIFWRLFGSLIQFFSLAGLRLSQRPVNLVCAQKCVTLCVIYKSFTAVLSQ